MDRDPEMKRNRRLLLLLAVGLIMAGACEVDNAPTLPAMESPTLEHTGHTLVARLIHVTDTQIIDEESPARFAGSQEFVSSAWRPYEAYATQLLDGTLRAINRIHASGRQIDFVLHTGDACDNSQSNELAWLIGLFDGEPIDPLTGPDDRPPDTRPSPLMDPHASFTAQGLYRAGVHGDLPSIPWYIVFGNHDRFAIGVFTIFQDVWGRRLAPLPFPQRPGLLIPAVLDPLTWIAHGIVTPANPGPPGLLELPSLVQPNPGRAFFNRQEFIRAMYETVTEPSGHGFADMETAPTWYSTVPVPGLRLIGLDTCEPAHNIEGFPYQDGSISAEQVVFLRTELDTARDNGELVIVASHHPSTSLWEGYGSALTGPSFRALLGEYPNVVAHLAGHQHRHRVADRQGYVEIETASTLDLPQEARLVEIWRDDVDGTVTVAYETFSHLDDDLPPLGDDPLRSLRQRARALAVGDTGATHRQKLRDPTGAEAAGRPSDRRGVIVLSHKP